MASHQSRKRKSTAEDEGGIEPRASTPTGSPVRKKMKITQSQKQALIDNLQLEITERARHLRAHYALQSSDLRSRIERRINRIPMSLRNANMGDLLVKYSVVKTDEPVPAALGEMTAPTGAASTSHTTLQAAKSHPLPPIPHANSSKPTSPVRPTASSSRPVKRVSTEIHIAMDKENEDGTAQRTDALPNLKNPKRVKATGPASRAASRTVKQSSVLSPKSHNSRTLPRSPIKDCPSPTKQNHSYIARPTSPLKPASPLKTAASVASSAISASLHGMVEHAKRGAGATARGLGRTASKEKNTTKSTAMTMAPPPRPTPHPQQDPTRTVSSASVHSNSSNVSASSTSTTIVKKAGRTTTKISQTTTEKKGSAATKTAMKKTAASTAAAKKVVVAEPAAGRRVLRKRN